MQPNPSDELLSGKHQVSLADNSAIVLCIYKSKSPVAPDGPSAVGGIPGNTEHGVLAGRLNGAIAQTPPTPPPRQYSTS